MLEKYKYFVTDPLAVVQQVFPAVKPKVGWDKNTDSFKHDYDVKISGDFIFKGEDFDIFYALETAQNRCDYFFLSIHQLCAGVYIPDWKQGRISLNSGKWDLDKCKVTFSIDALDRFSCYEDHKGDDFNIFDVTDRRTVNLVPGTVETVTCEKDNLITTPTGCPSGQGWILYYSRIFYDSTGRHETAKYARYNVGSGVYKPAIIYNPVLSTDTDGASIIQYLVSGIDGPSQIDNGVRLQDVIQMMLSLDCPTLTLRSDFFQWNPTNPSDINYVTGEASLVNNLILLQKSDVKRPDVSNDATLGILTPEDLIDNIRTIFNLQWDIVGTDFIIEHITWWTHNAGLDLTQARYTTEPFNYMKYSNRYSYTRDEMPKYENFSFMEGSNYDFAPKTISYQSSCVSNSKDSENKDYKADIITTDVNFVMSHPSDKDEQVSDEGFCLIACDSGNNIITLDFDFGFPNNSLSWSYLLRTYYLQGRVLLSGYIDGEPTEFVSAIKTRLQDKIVIPFCCDDTFIPTDLITTFLGNDGEVKSATFNLENDTLELNLVLGTEGLVILALVARSDQFTVPWNTTSGLNILANDSSTAGLDVTSVVIVQSPAHGVAVVNIDGTISYTPTTDYLGPDLLKYTVQDVNSVVSNIANVYITVVKTCTGATPVIVLIVRNDDNSITITGTAEAGSVIDVFGNATETGLYTQINSDYTEADLVAGITLTSVEVSAYSFIKVRSLSGDCDFGFSEFSAIPAAFLVTWAGSGAQTCLVDAFGDNTGYLGYVTRERLINGIADGYTEPNTVGTGIGDYIAPVLDVITCPPFVDENPVFFFETDETKVIAWTAHRRAIYGDMPTFQVWVYNPAGIPELNTVGLSADNTPPNQTTYTFYNAGARGYIEIQGNKDVVASGG